MAVVSIVVAAFNAERTIESTLRSVLRQTDQDFEIAVVDDGSIDRTLDVALGLDDDRITVHRQEQQGPAAARNLGIARTSGQFVCPLDADDLLLPTFLEHMRSALEGARDAGFAYTDAWTLDDSTGRIRRTSAKAYQRPPTHPPSEPRSFLRLLLERNFVYGCTLMRRSALEGVGPYAEDLRHGEDYELWLRIVAYNHRAVRVTGRLAVYREGQLASLSADVHRMLEAQVRIYERVAASYPVDESIRTAASERADQLRLALSAPSAGDIRETRSRVLRAALRRAREPFHWHRTRPPEIESLLAATEGWPASAGITRPARDPARTVLN